MPELATLFGLSRFDSPLENTESGSMKINDQTEINSPISGFTMDPVRVADVSPAKLLLTVRDCAAMTSLSEKTVLRLIQRGKLRCISSIRHKRVPAAELARFIRDNLS